MESIVKARMMKNIEGWSRLAEEDPNIASANRSGAFPTLGSSWRMSTSWVGNMVDYDYITELSDRWISALELVHTILPVSREDRAKKQQQVWGYKRWLLLVMVRESCQTFCIWAILLLCTPSLARSSGIYSAMEDLQEILSGPNMEFWHLRKGQLRPHVTCFNVHWHGERCEWSYQYDFHDDQEMADQEITHIWEDLLQNPKSSFWMCVH